MNDAGLLAMRAWTSNVIPFPTDDEARARLDLQQIRLHVQALDHELQELVIGHFWSSGEWAREAAAPIVRTECIRRYLTTAVTSALKSGSGGRRRRRRRRVCNAGEELQSALSATASSLARLGDPAVGGTVRAEALREITYLRARQQRLLKTLDELFEQTL